MTRPDVESLPAEVRPILEASESRGSPASSLLEEMGTVTDSDTISNVDDDSDARSMRSRQDSVEPSPDLVDGGGSRGGVEASGLVPEPGGGKNNLAAVSAEQHVGNTGKRPLADEDHRAAQGPLRKACDMCTKRKRKCNGQHPCSQCLETGVRDQCVYSPRLKSGRKKKVRINGVLFDENSALAPGAPGLALVAGPGGRRVPGLSYAVDTAAGSFSASGATGIAGHMENFFLAAYLRDFNRIVRLTSESSVTEGMLEVLSPAISSTGLAATSPIKQPESRRQAKLAVFWGVVAMGSRILGASDEATARYLGLMRTALRECFDCNDKEVVEAYLLLSTVETMRGNEEAGKRYLDHAHTMHNGNAMGPDGQLLKDRPEHQTCLDLLFQIFGQPDGCVGPTRSAAVRRTRHARHGSALDQMIAQAMSSPREPQSGPLKALKYLSTACGLSSEVFDPTNKCVTVKQYLGEMDAALKGAHSLFKHTDLSECITGVVMVKIWGGVTVLMRSWGQAEDKEIGLAQVEEGVGYALTRPGLMTFPMWWHALHCAAVVLAHFGHHETYMRLRATFNKNTFPDTEMPPIERYSPGAICPQLGGSCSKLAYWLQVRGSMCSGEDWKPQFNCKLSEEVENAAYAAALDTHEPSQAQAATNEAYTEALKSQFTTASYGMDTIVGGAPVQERPSSSGSASSVFVGSQPVDVRTALDAGMSEINTQLSSIGGLDTLSTSELELDSLGVEFDLSENDSVITVGGPTMATSNGALTPAVVGGQETLGSMEIPIDLRARRGGETGVTIGSETEVIMGGGPIVREASFGISGPAAASSMFSPLGVIGGEALARTTSLDINTIMQMATSDEELKQKEGGPDAMDTALAFGEGPAKELFGVELSTV